MTKCKFKINNLEVTKNNHIVHQILGENAETILWKKCVALNLTLEKKNNWKRINLLLKGTLINFKLEGTMGADQRTRNTCTHLPCVPRQDCS